MIENTYVMENVRKKPLDRQGFSFNITLEYAWSKSEKRTPHDRLDDIFDTRVYGRHLPGVL
jgi:hypothetical protein